MSMKLHNINILYDCIHKRFVVYVQKLKIRDKRLSWFCFIPILLFVGVVGLLTRLILIVWQMLPNNSYMFLDKSTKVVTFDIPWMFCN